MAAQRPRAGGREVAREEAGGAASVQAPQRLDGMRGQAANDTTIQNVVQKARKTMCMLLERP